MAGLNDAIKQIPFKHLFFMMFIAALICSDTFDQFAGNNILEVKKMVVFAVSYIFISIILSLGFL